MVLAVSPPPTPRGLAWRFTAIITCLCAAIAARAAKQRALQPLILQLWGALRRRAGRFERLVARVQAGRLSASRPASRPPRRHRPPAAGPRLPRRFAWLVRLAPETAVFGSQLRALLADPETAALLEAAPQAGRLLRPFCRMLGVRPGPALAPALVPPRRDRPPRRGRPPRPTPAKPHGPAALRPRTSRPWQLGSFLLPPRPEGDDPPVPP